jgi:magnesium chelatase subunit I
MVFAESGFELWTMLQMKNTERILGSIVPLEILVKKYQPQLEKEDKFFNLFYGRWLNIKN